MPKHASFFVFVTHLKLHESRRSDDLFNAIHDKCPVQKATHKRDQQRNEKIRTNTQLLCKGFISTEEFLNSMAGEDLRMYTHKIHIYDQKVCEICHLTFIHCWKKLFFWNLNFFFIPKQFKRFFFQNFTTSYYLDVF